jgi:hypothetical protein
VKKAPAIELRRYEKRLKCGWYHSRTVSKVTESSVYYWYDTDEGFALGVATIQQFRRWMKGCLPAEGGTES